MTQDISTPKEKIVVTLALNFEYVNFEEHFGYKNGDPRRWAFYSLNRREGGRQTALKFFRRDPQKDGDYDALKSNYRKKAESGHLFFVSAYIHGGTEYGLEGNVTQCRSDSVYYAGILFLQDAREFRLGNYDAYKESAKNYIKSYQRWANNDLFSAWATINGEDLGDLSFFAWEQEDIERECNLYAQVYGYDIEFTFQEGF